MTIQGGYSLDQIERSTSKSICLGDSNWWEKERGARQIHKRLLYCVNVNRTSLDHLLLGEIRRCRQGVACPKYKFGHISEQALRLLLCFRSRRGSCSFAGTQGAALIDSRGASDPEPSSDMFVQKASRSRQAADSEVAHRYSSQDSGPRARGAQTRDSEFPTVMLTATQEIEETWRGAAPNAWTCRGFQVRSTIALTGRCPTLRGRMPRVRAA